MLGGSTALAAATSAGLTTGNATAAPLESVAAVIDNRAGEVGIALCSLTSLGIDLTQFGDGASFSKAVSHLTSRGAVEVLVPHTATRSRLVVTLQEQLPECAFIAVERRSFNETVGAHRLAELMSTGDALGDVLDSGHYLCVAAGAALVAHVEAAQRCKLVPHTVRVRVIGLADFVTIDRATVAALQLRGVAESVDRTVTPMGRRLLRTNILQPPRNEHTIALRLEAVQFLRACGCGPLRAALGRIGQRLDLERATAVLSRSSGGADGGGGDGGTMVVIMALFDIVRVFDSVPEVQAVATAAMGTGVEVAPALLLEIVAALAPECCFAALRTVILETLDREIIAAAAAAAGTSGGGGGGMGGSTQNTTRAMQQVQTCFAVRGGLSGLLDAARRHYSITLDKIFNSAAELKATHSISSLKLAHDTRRGYYLAFDRRHESLAPAAVFISRSRKGPRVSCTTEGVEQLNAALADLTGEIVAIQGTILAPVVAAVQENVGALQQLAESIALLDMLVCFASQGLAEWALPQLRRDGEAQGAEGSREEEEEAVMMSVAGATGSASPRSFTPNDARVVHGLTVLTGPNGSGKTSYLRMLGQLAVLAHVGCMVPAASMTFVPADAIMCHFANEVGVGPMVAHGSGFMQDMRGAAQIVFNATRLSLVLIDELACGTSAADGGAIAQAVAEWLDGVGCGTVMATHFIHHIPRVVPPQRNIHFVADVDGGLRFRFKVAPGVCSVDHYGLRLAEKLHFCSPEVIETARRILEDAPEKPN